MLCLEAIAHASAVTTSQVVSFGGCGWGRLGSDAENSAALVGGSLGSAFAGGKVHRLSLHVGRLQIVFGGCTSAGRRSH